jgi:hypothetical protein
MDTLKDPTDNFDNIDTAPSASTLKTVPLLDSELAQLEQSLETSNTNRNNQDFLNSNSDKTQAERGEAGNISDFLSLFETQNPNDIELAYLDTVIFQPLDKQDVLLNNKNTTNNILKSSLNSAMYDDSTSLNYRRLQSRALDLERERNG